MYKLLCKQGNTQKNHKHEHRNTKKNHKLNTLATDVLYKECTIQKKNIHKVHFTA
jgi:hypothetical protein